MRVLRSGRSAAASAGVRRLGIGLAALVTVFVVGTRGTQDAVANGDTRTLTLYHNNTKESLTVTFRRNGQYDSNALDQLNWFLRDWRRSETTKMDPRLFDTVWEVYREVGASEPVQVNSAYRSPNTNAMLRRRSSAVAKNSQHMQGKAMDFYISDASTAQLRAIGMRLQRGGVGYYPNAYTPFVHLDVGSVRSWPRMTRDQLARIFPDGKTVHIPADGRPMEGYQEARAEVLARGGSVAGYSMVAEAEEAAQPRRKSFWATLFGGSDEDEDVEEIRAASRPGRNLFATRGTNQRNPYAADNDSPTSVLQAYNEGRSAPQPTTRVAAVAPQRAPEPEPEPVQPRVTVAAAPPPPAAFREPMTPPPLPPTRIAGLPSTVATPSGPALAWQQGPAGQNANGVEMSIGRSTDLAPLPPRRPGAGGGDEIVATGAIAYAPMPPARPGSLAATNPIPALTELRGPVQAVAALQGVDHPLPPPRPGMRPVAVASAGPIEIPAAPVPTAPAIKAKEPAKKEPVRIEAVKPEPAKSAKPLASPTTTASISAASKAAASPAKAKASVLTANGPGLNMGFSAKPMGDLATNRFTGPAVKPLQVR
ncbi:DUF882 domain-containing protein [Microvirga pudoricolor]|uniref:DUF882 domain-containing protein n=1 Tax=Microvirga pudoricolor TaxID=2778729 RepID=UPI0019511AB7|nr:DUF882 domain-containing protein [Microvirga pudoricolor]MBM6594950.1 DUF882 domain-containing protein [Microvirga pudoricolor]